MKNLYLFVLCTVVAVGLQAQDSVSVIFAIDVSAEATISPDGIHMAGNLQNKYAGTTCNEWSPNCTPLADADGDKVWTVKLRLPVGTYQYKYINGNAWGINEGSGTGDCGVDDGNGGFNRTLDLTNAPLTRDTVIGPFIYNSCTLSSITVASIDREFANNLQLSIAPNPVIGTSEISFANPRNEPFTMTITTLTGHVVRSEVVTGTSAVIQRGAIASGMYLVTLRNREGQRASSKVMFQ